MAIARAQLADVSLTRWYHCVTHCVRRVFLLGERKPQPPGVDGESAQGTCGDLCFPLAEHVLLPHGLCPAYGVTVTDPSSATAKFTRFDPLEICTLIPDVWGLASFSGVRNR
jgi:hypothetical protein